MLGTFSPQPEPYTYVTPEDTTPSGMFARGSYSARTKVRTYLDAERVSQFRTLSFSLES
jgi:Rho GDP-dissociation inhibitor